MEEKKLKNKQDRKSFLINVIISLISICLGAYLGYFFSKRGELETRIYQNNGQALSEILEHVHEYEDYFTVNWSKLSEEKNSNYVCEGYEKYDEAIRKNNVQSPCVHWNKLRNAKVNFHRLTAEARIRGSENIVTALQGTEEGFEEVFAKMVQQPYYTRSFGDSYNEVMPEKFKDLEKVFKEELNK